MSTVNGKELELVEDVKVQEEDGTDGATSDDGAFPAGEEGVPVEKRASKKERETEKERESEKERKVEPEKERESESAEEMESAEEEQGIRKLEAYLDGRVMRAIREMGFEKMTPIQEQAIPLLLEGKDIIGQAQTGTGKTAAFGIPIIQKIDPDNRGLQAVILCPTRELAVQAAEEIRRLAKFMQGVKVLPVYGGQDIGKQINGLKGTQIIVGTPGRVMDHMRRHTIKLDHVSMVVLDEADEMLDMGFREDMELILGEIPGEHQTALFSATMPQPILEIADKFQKDAEFIHVASEQLTIPLVSQHYYRISSRDKDAACLRLLDYYQPRLCLIFCNTKKKVDELAEFLKKQGCQAEGLHGDMSQSQRDVAMGRFRNGSTNILIATDVAARGIDVENVEAVINYDLPQDIEYYVHRIGRTGRAGKTGSSFTFVTGREVFRIRQIERFCHTTIDEWKLPGAAKVLKVKAEKFLDEAWALKDNEDIALMKKFLNRKMEQEGCDAMDIAAVLLKYYVGDKGEEIQEDEEPAEKRRRFGRGRDKDRDDRRGKGGDREESRKRGDGRKRDRDREEEREEKREKGRGRDREDGWKRDRDREEEREEKREKGRSRTDKAGKTRGDKKDDGETRNRAERRSLIENWGHSRADEKRINREEAEGAHKGGMKKGKTTDRGRGEGWWSTAKLPFSTRDRRRKH